MNCEIKHGDWVEVLKTMPSESVHTVCTSPPYWRLRDYGIAGQLGLERTPDEYVAKVVEGFREVRRVLRRDGTLWMNLGDSYAVSGKGGNQCDSPHHKQATNRGSDVYVKSKTIKRGNGRWGGGNNPASNCKPKDLVGIPWMVAFALRSDGWYLRQDIIWSKPNPMPESVTDRCTKAHEYLFLLSKSARYYFDQDAILEPCSLSTHARLAQDVQAQIGSARVPGKTNGNMKAVGRKTLPETQHRLGQYRDTQIKLAAAGSGIKNNASFDAAMAIMPETRNKRSVWEVTTQPYSEAHFATFPAKLIEPCILAGCPEGGTVLDPFSGAGTTGLVATRLHRDYLGIELNQEYIAMSRRRIEQDAPLFNTPAPQHDAINHEKQVGGRLL